MLTLVGIAVLGAYKDRLSAWVTARTSPPPQAASPVQSPDPAASPSPQLAGTRPPRPVRTPRGAAANPKPERKPTGASPRGDQTYPRTSKDLDKNDDGVVDNDEAQQAFKFYDKNADGQLSQAEGQALKEAMRATNRRIFRKLIDANRDGKVTAGERWDSEEPYDRNHDGELDQDEVREFRRYCVRTCYPGDSWRILRGPEPGPAAGKP